MIFKNSKLLIVILTLLLLISVVVLVVGVYTIKIKNQEVSALLNLAEEKSQSEVRAQYLRIARVEAREDIEKLDSLIISEKGLINFIEKIEEAARKLSLDIKVVSIDKGDDASGGANIVRLVVETSGEWGEAFAFLVAVENLPYKVTIEEVDFSKEEDVWRSNLVLILNTFNN